MRKHSRTTRNSAKKFRRLSLAAVVAMVILAIAAVTVLSRQTAKVQEPGAQEGSAAVTKKTKKNIVTVEVAGQQVQVDSQTGQVQELTPEEAQKMAAGLKQLINKSVEDREQVQEPDGSVSVNLEDRFQNVTVAKVDENGNLVQSCVDNARAAGKFFGIDPKQIDSKQIDNKNETPNHRAPVTPATNGN